MNIIREKAYKNRYKVTIKCPICGLIIDVTSTSREASLQVVDNIWTLHKEQDHNDESKPKTYKGEEAKELGRKLLNDAGWYKDQKN